MSSVDVSSFFTHYHHINTYNLNVNTGIGGWEQCIITEFIHELPELFAVREQVAYRRYLSELLIGLCWRHLYNARDIYQDVESALLAHEKKMPPINFFQSSRVSWTNGLENLLLRISPSHGEAAGALRNSMKTDVSA